MGKLFQTAANVATPLALAGLFGMAFFLILRQLLGKNIFSKFTSENSKEVVIKIIDRLFVLSLVALVLGAFAFILPYVLANDTQRGSGMEMAKILEDRHKEISKVLDEAGKNVADKANFQEFRSKIEQGLANVRDAHSSNQDVRAHESLKEVLNLIHSEDALKFLDSLQLKKIGDAADNYDDPYELSPLDELMNRSPQITT